MTTTPNPFPAYPDSELHFDLADLGYVRTGPQCIGEFAGMEYMVGQGAQRELLARVYADDNQIVVASFDGPLTWRATFDGPIPRGVIVLAAQSALLS